nr:hypothetical protein [Mycoplasmopsis canis]WQQ12437.1 hypothetical protein RRG48_00085 [Mycoplasmopsis canis]
MKIKTKILLTTSLVGLIVPTISCTNTQKNHSKDSENSNNIDNSGNLSELNNAKYDIETISYNLVDAILEFSREDLKPEIDKFLNNNENAETIEKIKNTEVFNLIQNLHNDDKFKSFKKDVLDNFAKGIKQSLNDYEAVVTVLDQVAKGWISVLSQSLIPTLKLNNLELTKIKEFFSDYGKFISFYHNKERLIRISNIPNNRNVSSKYIQYSQEIKKMISDFESANKNIFKNFSFKEFSKNHSKISDTLNSFLELSNSMIDKFDKNLWGDFINLNKKETKTFSIMSTNIIDYVESSNNAEKIIEASKKTVDNRELFTKIKSDEDRILIKEFFKENQNEAFKNYDFDLKASHFVEVSLINNNENIPINISLFNRDEKTNSFELLDDFEENNETTKISSIVPKHINHLVKINLHFNQNVLRKLRLHNAENPNFEKINKSFEEKFKKDKNIENLFFLFQYKFNNLIAKSAELKDENTLEIETAISANRENLYEYIDLDANSAVASPKHFFVSTFTLGEKDQNKFSLEANLSFDITFGISDEVYEKLFGKRFKKLGEEPKNGSTNKYVSEEKIVNGKKITQVSSKYTNDEKETFSAQYDEYLDKKKKIFNEIKILIK